MFSRHKTRLATINRGLLRQYKFHWSKEYLWLISLTLCLFLQPLLAMSPCLIESLDSDLDFALGRRKSADFYWSHLDPYLHANLLFVSETWPSWSWKKLESSLSPLFAFYIFFLIAIKDPWRISKHSKHSDWTVVAIYLDAHEILGTALPESLIQSRS